MGAASPHESKQYGGDLVNKDKVYTPNYCSHVITDALGIALRLFLSKPY